MEHIKNLQNKRYKYIIFKLTTMPQYQNTNLNVPAGLAGALLVMPNLFGMASTLELIGIVNVFKLLFVFGLAY